MSARPAESQIRRGRNLEIVEALEGAWSTKPQAQLQVLHNKTNSINTKLKWQFGHRLITISVCEPPEIINGKPEMGRCAAWDLLPVGTPDVL